MVKQLILFLSIPFISFAEGIEIVYEIEFEHNNKIHVGYITGGYSSIEIDSTFFYDDKQFELSVKNWDRNIKELEVYSELIDWTSVMQVAIFPVQPFEIGGEVSVYPTNEIKKLHLIKIWKRSDYHIKVFSPITIRDTSWYDNSFIISKPVGDDAGCRLELYSFEKHSNNQELIKKFKQVYLNPKVNNPIYYNYRKRILELLYLQKVIVIELCGC
jgi:hypothetical protein